MRQNTKERHEHFCRSLAIKIVNYETIDGNIGTQKKIIFLIGSVICLGDKFGHKYSGI